MKTDPIIIQVVAKMLQRSSVGIEKYGTTLADNNEDDFLVHLQEELLDAAAYIEKLIQQRSEKKPWSPKDMFIPKQGGMGELIPCNFPNTSYKMDR